MLPKISVIIGVLNMQEGLRRALNSVIEQHYPLSEIIIIDGQSTDGTLDVIQEYTSSIHYWKSEKDLGHIDACNKGLVQASGELIFLLNADDEITPDLFHKIAITYQNNPQTEMLSCGIKILKENRVIKVVDSADQIDLNLKNILFGMPLTNARFYHRNLFEKYGYFQAMCDDGSYYISNDREFLTRLILNDVTTEIIAEPLYLYHSHPDSLTFGTKNLIKIHEEHLWLAENLLSSANLNNKNHKLIKQWRARETVVLTYFYLKKNNFRSAYRTIKNGILSDFYNIFLQFMNLLFKKILPPSFR